MTTLAQAASRIVPSPSSSSAFPSGSSSARSRHLCAPSPPGSVYGVSTIGSARGVLARVVIVTSPPGR
jgi:hypothetical protein